MDLHNKILEFTIKDDPRAWWREYPPRFIDHGKIILGDKIAKNLKAIFSDKDNQIGVYIHIPFCFSRCRYCKFYTGLYKSSEEVNYYLDCLEKELTLYKTNFKNVPLDSLYIGGGTPTVLNERQWRRLFNIINNFFVIKKDAQVMTEGTPKTSTYKKLKLLRKLGVNRFTIGAQSFDEKVLKKANRRNSVKDTYRSYLDARKAGIPIINLDIILGLVGETWQSYNLMFQGIADLRPDCASILYLDCGHLIDPEYDKEAQKTEFLNNEKTRQKVLSNLWCILERLGYEQSQGSSESTFVLKEKRNAANQNLINRLKLGYTFGIGISAESSLGPFKYRTTLNKQEYFDDIKKGQLPKFFGMELNKDEHIRRYFIYNFLHWGKINKADFQRHFKKKVSQTIRDKFKKLILEQRLFDIKEDIIFLPVSKTRRSIDKYLSLSNSSKKGYYSKLSRNLLFCIRYFYSSRVINKYREHFKNIK